MTVSTSGLALASASSPDQPLQIRLAISLHGATDEVRACIMPVNRKYPPGGTPRRLRALHHPKKQYLTFEYILIKDVNDTEEQALALAKHALRLNAKVNLIPYNTVTGTGMGASGNRCSGAFLRILLVRKVQATLRREKGHDIAAACGQLRLQTVA